MPLSNRKSMEISNLVSALWNNVSNSRLDVIINGNTTELTKVKQRNEFPSYVLARWHNRWESVNTRLALFPTPELSYPFYLSNPPDQNAGPQHHFPGCAYILTGKTDYSSSAEIYDLQGGFKFDSVDIEMPRKAKKTLLYNYGKLGAELVIAFADFAREQKCLEIEYTNDNEAPGSKNLVVIANNLMQYGYEIYLRQVTSRTAYMKAIDQNHEYLASALSTIDNRFVHITEKLS